MRGNTTLKAALALGLCCFFLYPVFAQTISGKLIDAQTLTPIEGARISCGEHLSMSDADGKFIVRKCEEGIIAIWHLNYIQDIEVSTLADEDNIIRLAPQNFLIGIAESEAFQQPGSRRNSLSNANKIGPEILAASDESSLMNAVNLVPGVKMEERGYGGSRRINIRGSFLRSPFAVRNIKLYFEGIPMTSPDGSSPLELFDNADIGGIEVIKGPAGSQYGAGNGGVLLMSGKRRGSEGASVGSSIAFGSFGYIRSSSAADYSDSEFDIRTSFHHQQTDGYREQEANRKQQLNLFAHYYPKENLSYHLYVTNYEGDWQLPGSINAESVADDPTQAIEYSVDGNASVNRDRFRFGLSQKLELFGRLNNVTSVYMNQTDKTNAYGTSPFFNGYKDEMANGGGVRSVFDIEILDRPEKGLRIAARIGGEYQSETGNLTEWTNNLGEPGDLKYENLTESTAWMGFGSLELNWRKLSAQIENSWYNTMYVNSGLSYASDSTSLNAVLDLGTYSLPRFALGFNATESLSLFASAGHGISYPSLFEMLDTETGELDPDLEGELGESFEGGIKLTVKDDLWYLQATAYQMTLSNTIIPSDEGLFQNLGTTDLSGLEAMSQLFIPLGLEPVEVVSLITSISWNHYFFRDQQIGDTNLDGKFLTGVPLASVSNQLELFCFERLTINVFHNWYDQAPINNSNEDWASAYHVVNGKVNWIQHFGKLRVDVFAGTNNLTNTSYSSFLQLNGFGGRYYNPSPERNFFGGLKVRLEI